MTHNDRCVGFLLGGNAVICRDKECYDALPFDLDSVCFLYHGNVYPYNQDCCVCHKQIVIGQSVHWPVLFDGDIEGQVHEDS